MMMMATIAIVVSFGVLDAIPDAKSVCSETESAWVAEVFEAVLNHVGDLRLHVARALSPVNRFYHDQVADLIRYRIKESCFERLLDPFSDHEMIIDTMKMILGRTHLCSELDPHLFNFLSRYPSPSLADVMKAKLTEPNGLYVSDRIIFSWFGGDPNSPNRSVVLDFIQYLVDDCGYRSVAGNIIGGLLGADFTTFGDFDDLIVVLATSYDLSVFGRIPPPYSDQLWVDPLPRAPDNRARLPLRLELHFPPRFGSFVAITNELDLARMRDDPGLLLSLLQTGHHVSLQPKMYRDLSVSDFVQIAPYLRPWPYDFGPQYTSMIAALPDLVHWGRIDLVRAILRVRSVIQFLIEANNLDHLFYLYWAFHIAHRFQYDDLLHGLLGLIGRSNDQVHSGLKFWERQYHLALLVDHPEDWSAKSVSDVQTRYLHELRSQMRDDSNQRRFQWFPLRAGNKFRILLQKRYPESRHEGDLAALRMNRNDVVFDYFGFNEPMFLDKCRRFPAPSYI